MNACKRISFLALMAMVVVSGAHAQQNGMENNECATLSGLEWILGSWEEKGARNTTFETWTKVSENTFEGTGLVQRTETGEIRGQESLLLSQMGNNLFYIAKPRQNEFPTGFKLVNCTSASAVFENMGHDFPKRIAYTLVDPDHMNVLVSDAADQAFSIRFVRKK